MRQDKDCPLAVFSPFLGAPSETFIKRHQTELLPNRTAVVYGRKHAGYLSEWEPNGPSFDLSARNPLSLRLLLHASVNLFKTERRPLYYPFLKTFVRHHKVEAILCEYLDYSTRWLELARELGIRFYAHAHGYDISMRLKDPKWIDRYQNLNKANRVITVNEMSRQSLIELGIDQSKIVSVPCGVEIPDSEPVYSGEIPTRCLAVGRLTGKKGPIYLLESFRKALAKCPDLTLTIVGDGELMPSVVQYTDAFQLHERIKILGSQPNDFVRDQMQRSDIFLQHSVTNPVNGDEEGLPVAILEAMAFGLPVVSTRHAGIPEAVEHGETGYLVGEGDVEDMAQQIVKLATNPSLRESLGKNGKKLAREKFTWKKERSKLLEIMELE